MDAALVLVRARRFDFRIACLSGADELGGRALQEIARGCDFGLTNEIVQFGDEPARELIDLGEGVDLTAAVVRLEGLAFPQADRAGREMPGADLLCIGQHVQERIDVDARVG